MFDLVNVGLGNNGGSFSIVNSANTLLDMGHDVVVIDSGRNQHTWTELRAEHRIIGKQTTIPDAKVVIASGSRSVSHVCRLPERCGVKFHWIRGWESWTMTDSQLIDQTLKVPTIKMVNSLCLQDKLRSLGFKSYLIRPGYDIEHATPIGKRINSTINLGGLYAETKHWTYKRTDWIIMAANILKGEFDNIQLHMFGTRDPKNPHINHYIRSPNAKEKLVFYNNVDIFLAPNSREGLTMPPAEAMLTECPVVGTDTPMSGMQDYLFNCQTGIVTKDTFQAFVEGIKVLINMPKERLHMGKQARKHIITLGTRKQNMEQMVSLFKGMI